MLFYVLRVICFLPLKILFPTRIICKKNKIKKGRVILCCNHQSNNDVPIIAISFHRRFSYMAKKSLFNNKFFGWLIKKLGAYPVDREKTDLKAMKKTIDLLKAEKGICLFPQGTRISEMDSAQLKNGAIIFSLKTNSPILPSVFIRKPSVFKRNRYVIGEPIKLYEMDEFKDKKIDEELIEKGKNILFQKMLELQENNKFSKK